jgi:hypothetical protein
MRAYVLHDAGLARQAGRFVWLEVNAEADASAPFLERFPVEVYPTLFVLDPAGERALVKWAGSASAGQVSRLLDEGRAALAGARGPEALLGRGDAALAEERAADAAAAYREAIAAGGPRWAGRGRAAEALVTLLSTRDDEGCTAEARRLAPTLPRGPSRASIVQTGLACALELPDVSGSRAARADLERAARAAVGWPGLSVDLRSGLHSAIVNARTAAKDEAGARAAAARWWAFLAAERARAPDAQGRSALNAATVSAAVAMGDPARALPLVRRSEAELPGDYDPPYRLAMAAREAGRLGEALAAADRALALGYGPRKLRMYALKASVQAQQGDRAAQRATLESGLAYARALPAAQLRSGDRALLEKLQTELDGLDGAG